MSTLQYQVTVKQDGNAVISNATNTVNVTGSTNSITGTNGQGLVVPANTANMPCALSITYAKLASLFWYASGTITLTTNGVNAVQSVTLASATGGTFTITYGGQTTSAIAYNATAAIVQAALQALSSIGSGNVTVTGSAGGPYTLTFVGSLGVQPITTVTCSGAGLTGGGASVTPATVTTGVAPDQTFTINPGSVMDWNLADGYFSNPITANVTRVNLTNNTGAAVVFFLIAGMSA